MYSIHISDSSQSTGINSFTRSGLHQLNACKKLNSSRFVISHCLLFISNAVDAMRKAKWCFLWPRFVSFLPRDDDCFCQRFLIGVTRIFIPDIFFSSSCLSACLHVSNRYYCTTRSGGRDSMPVMHSLTHCPHAIFIIVMKRRRKERQKELRRSRSRYVAYYYMQSFNLSPSRHSLRKQLHMSIYVQVRRFMYAGTGRSYYYYSQVSSALLPGTDSRRVAHTPWSSHLFTRRSDSLNLVFLCRWQSFRISLFFLSFILLFVKLALQ